MTPLTENEVELLKQGIEYLDLAYKHHFLYGDGHHKSSEGHVALSFSFGNTFERTGVYDPPDPDVGKWEVHVYSYLFCTGGRTQYFDSIEEFYKWAKNAFDHELEEVPEVWGLDPEGDPGPWDE